MTIPRNPIAKLKERQRAINAVDWLREWSKDRSILDVSRVLKLELCRPLVAFWLHTDDSKRTVPRKIEYVEAIEKLKKKVEAGYVI